LTGTQITYGINVAQLLWQEKPAVSHTIFSTRLSISRVIVLRHLTFFSSG